MKPSELQNKDAAELRQLAHELESKLLQLNFDLHDKKLKDVSQLGKVKRDIARVLTALRQLRA